MTLTDSPETAPAEPALAEPTSVGPAQRRPAPDPELSDRQREILQHIADGLTTKQAAMALGITHKTVHNHLHGVYRRLGAQTLTHAVCAAVRLGEIRL